MPIVNIKIARGRSIAQKREMVEKVTLAISESIGVPKSAVWITIEDIEMENLARGGELRLDKAK